MEKKPAQIKDQRPSNRPFKYAKIVKDLEIAFSIGCTVSEACLYAGISRQTFYNWCEKNSTLMDRFLALQEKPILQARQTVVKSLKNNPEMAFRFLERKRKDEFSPKLEVEHDAKKGSTFKVEITCNENKVEPNKEAEPDVELPAGRPNE